MAYIYLKNERGFVLEIEKGNERYWLEKEGYTRIPATEGREHLRNEAWKALLDVLKPGDTVYTCMRKVSGSGMSREISLHVAAINKDTGKPYILNITRYAARLTTRRVGKHDGLVMDGCGMDMGFSAVYSLGMNLWPDGTPEPHGTRNGKPDYSGGYALKHEWI